MEKTLCDASCTKHSPENLPVFFTGGGAILMVHAISLPLMAGLLSEDNRIIFPKPPKSYESREVGGSNANLTMICPTHRKNTRVCR